MSSLHIRTGETGYWREVPHVFTPSSWGRQYCLLCADFKRQVIHLDPESLPPNDPRRFAGFERSSGLWEQTWWKVEGWNEDGGACSYGFDHRTGPMDSKEAAERYLAYLVENGDERGTRYEHYAVVEIRHYSVCTSLVHPITNAKET